MSRIVFVLVFGLAVGFFVSGPAFAALVIQSSTIPYSKVPQGTAKVPMLYFTMGATATDNSVKRIGFRNDSPTVKFGQGVSAVYIYQDDGDGVFNSTDVQRGSLSGFSGSADVSQNIQFTSAITVATTSTVGFFVLYDVDSSAQSGVTTNVRLNFVESGTTPVDLASNSSVATSNTVTITGISATANSIATSSVVLLGQSLVPMLRLELRPIEENLSASLSVTIGNDSRNFVTTDGGTTGVTAVYLYNDTDANGLFDSSIDQRIQTKAGTGITSSSEVTFTAFSPPFTLAGNTSKYFFVVYDIGEDISVSSDATVQAQVLSVTGRGSDSVLPMSLVSATPVTAVSSKIAGVVYSDLASVVPSSNYSPGNQEIPVLRFTLKSENISVTVNKITIRNDGTVSYITNPTSTNGVTRVRLYEDTNLNDAYDGIVADTLIGSLVLGNGLGQTALLAPITLSGSGLAITTGNEKTIFAVYDLGIGTTTQKTASGDVTSIAVAKLEDAIATSNLTTIDIELSGTLPASSSPNAQVPVQSAMVSLISIQSMSPGTAIRGQLNVPMLYMAVRAEQTVTSSVFSILNNLASFLDNNTGVSRVSIYLDDNQNGVLDTSDILKSSTPSFNSTLRTDLPAFALPQGTNYFIVAYDVGQLASTSTVAIAAQLNNIVVSGNVVIFGGELPVPQYAATLNVTSGSISVATVNASVSSVTNTSAAFTVSIRVQNTSSGAIQIEDVFPRFYLSSIAGSDVSYEWAATTTQSFPFSLPALSGVTVSYTVSPANVFSQGTVVVDGAVKYLLSTDKYALLNRYKSNNTTWISAAQSTSQLTVSSSKTRYSWQIPDYISSVEVNSGSLLSSFQSYDAIPVNSSLRVTFANGGQFVDPASVSLVQTTTGSSSSTVVASSRIRESASASASSISTSALSTTYTLDDGTLEITGLGSQSGNLQLSIRDSSGALLPTANLRYLISSTVQVDRFLFYPNPYTVGSTLRLGFSMTQPSRVQIYLYNLNGIVVWSYDTTFASIGYKEIDWNGVLSSGQLIASGMYVAKMVATDNSGNKAYSYTKLAVY